MFVPNTLRVFGDCELLGVIARSGMGVVYEARQRGLDRIVALKMILSGPFASCECVQRFRAEASSTAMRKPPSCIPFARFLKSSVAQGQSGKDQ